MFKKILKIEESFKAWILLAILSFGLIVTSLTFQHIVGLEPCVLCIYQRIGVMIIFLSSIFGLIAIKTKTKELKTFAYATWISGSIIGLNSAVKQWSESENPFGLSQCGMGLDYYIPFIGENGFLSSLFIGKGICSEIDWSMFGLSMHHYTMLAFSLFLASSIIFYSLKCYKGIKKCSRH